MVVRVKCESEWNAINLLGTMMARLNDRNRIATFIEKLAHCL